MAARRDHALTQSPGAERWSLMSGLLFASSQLAALAFSMLVVVPTHAPIDAPPRATAQALAAHPTLIAVGTYLFVVPIPFFLVFLGGLFGVLRRAEGGTAPLSVAMLAAGSGAALIAPFGAVVSSIASGMARLGGDPVVVKQIDAMTPLAMALTGAPYAVLVGATLIVLDQRRQLPRRVVWFGWLIVLLGLAASGTLVLAALFPLVVLEMTLFPIWVMAVTLVVLAQQRAAAQEGALRSWA